jgi:hypothetical protein
MSGKYPFPGYMASIFIAITISNKKRCPYVKIVLAIIVLPSNRVSGKVG